MVALGLLLLPLLLLSAIFLDLGKIYVLQAEGQVAADAAALAGGSGLLDGQDEGTVVARVHHYVNDNPVAGDKASVDSIIIDLGLATVRVVLGFNTGPMLLSQGGVRLHARAGAEVVDAVIEAGAEPAYGASEAGPAKRLRLRE
jgi:Putative Flp pilus-assembly TadE/G-like